MYGNCVGLIEFEKVLTEMILEEIDLDWFWLLPTGQFLHFASGGNGFVPKYVRDNVSTQNHFFDYLLATRPSSEVRAIVDNIPTSVNERNFERYIRSFKEMSTRGLFSFDVCGRPAVNAPYRLVTCPISALDAKYLPRQFHSYFENCKRLSLEIDETDFMLIQSN